MDKAALKAILDQVFAALELLTANNLFAHLCVMAVKGIVATLFDQIAQHVPGVIHSLAPASVPA